MPILRVMESPATHNDYRPRITTIFLAAFLGGAAAAVGVNRFLDSHRQSEQLTVECEPIFVAARGIAAGDPVTVWDVSLKDWPKATAPADALKIDDSLDGHYAIRTVREGQPLVHSVIAKHVPRAASFPVEPDQSAAEDAEPFDIPQPPAPPERSTSIDQPQSVVSIGSPPHNDPVTTVVVGDDAPSSTLAADIPAQELAPLVGEEKKIDAAISSITEGALGDVITPLSQENELPQVITTEPLDLKTSLIVEADVPTSPPPVEDAITGTVIAAAPETTAMTASEDHETATMTDEGTPAADAEFDETGNTANVTALPTIDPITSAPDGSGEAVPSIGSEMVDVQPATEGPDGSVGGVQTAPLRFLVIPERIAAIVDGPVAPESSLRTIDPPVGLLPQQSRNSTSDRSASSALPPVSSATRRQASATGNPVGAMRPMTSGQRNTSHPAASMRGSSRDDGSQRQRMPSNSDHPSGNAGAGRPLFRGMFPNVSAGMNRFGHEISERLRRSQE